MEAKDAVVLTPGALGACGALSRGAKASERSSPVDEERAGIVPPDGFGGATEGETGGGSGGRGG